MNDYISMCMYIINKIPHGKCFVDYLIFMGSFLYQKLTCSLCSLIQLVTYSQLIHKYSMGTLSSKYYILYNDVSYLFFCYYM